MDNAKLCSVSHMLNAVGDGELFEVGLVSETARADWQVIECHSTNCQGILHS